MENIFEIPLDANTKASPFILFKKDKLPNRTRAGIYAVMGNRDSIGDRIANGAFAKTHKEGRKNIVHLWDHGQGEMTLPTATIDDLYEIGKSDLPDEVLASSPEATGAAVVVRTYLDTPYSNHLLAAVDSGAIKQMSFAYAIPKGKSEQIAEEIKGEQLTTRIIREVKQFDTSDVRWGANGATIAQFKSLFAMPALDGKTFFQKLATLLTEMKAGAHNGPVDIILLQQIHALLCELLPGVCAIDPAPEPSDKNDELSHFQVSLALAQARSKLQQFAVEL
jgi:HK97 family phage prohead protease